MPATRSKRTMQIWQMYNEGKSNGEIAKELGVSYSLVTSALCRGRDEGVVPPVILGSPLSYGTPYYMTRGTMGYVVTHLSREQQVWLAKLAKQYGCETMAEIIVEIVRDAHALEEDENGGVEQTAA